MNNELGSERVLCIEAMASSNKATGKLRDQQKINAALQSDLEDRKIKIDTQRGKLDEYKMTIELLKKKVSTLQMWLLHTGS